MSRRRLLSGVQPSGKIHLGNYLGALRQFIDSQSDEGTERFLFIANYHALTSLSDRAIVREYSLEVARTYLAVGLDPERTLIFLQSDVPEVCELAWFLSTVTPMGLLERATSYKDKIARGLTPNHALFAYPVLQAADILIYDSHLVPVGRDQKQHIEMTRDMAIKFNATFGETFIVPEPQIQENLALIPGTDGQKMSKSYGNTIDLFDERKAMKAQISSIVTDSKGLDEPKDPDGCTVFQLYRYFATPDEIAEMAERYRAGGYGYGHAKMALLDKIQDYMAPYRERYRQLSDNPDRVIEVLREGAKKARAVARATTDRARDAVGML
ncbi:MAG: tryptophan--tRNA ligase [Myxococcales bacterium]|nr:tryptophan--tRNA ligase [Myxococcales bacterium]